MCRVMRPCACRLFGFSRPWSLVPLMLPLSRLCFLRLNGFGWLFGRFLGGFVSLLFLIVSGRLAVFDRCFCHILSRCDFFRNRCFFFRNRCFVLGWCIRFGLSCLRRHLPHFADFADIGVADRCQLFFWRCCRARCSLAINIGNDLSRSSGVIVASAFRSGTPASSQSPSKTLLSRPNSRAKAKIRIFKTTTPSTRRNHRLTRLITAVEQDRWCQSDTPVHSTCFTLNEKQQSTSLHHYFISSDRADHW